MLLSGGWGGVTSHSSSPQSSPTLPPCSLAFPHPLTGHLLPLCPLSKRLHHSVSKRADPSNRTKPREGRRATPVSQVCLGLLRTGSGRAVLQAHLPQVPKVTRTALSHLPGGWTSKEPRPSSRKGLPAPTCLQLAHTAWGGGQSLSRDEPDASFSVGRATLTNTLPFPASCSVGIRPVSSHKAERVRVVFAPRPPPSKHKVA